MALIVCPECGGKLSDKADFCPHCGYNQFKREEKIADYVNCEEKNIYDNEYMNITEVELNSLVEQCITKIYPQLFGKDIISQQKEYLKKIDDIFDVLEKINSKNELLLMNKKYKKVPYLHLALYLSTSQYLAISKNYLETILDSTFSDSYEEIGLHLETMNDDFGEVFILEEKYEDFLEFSSLYHKIRFREKNSMQGTYIIYQYGSSVDKEHQLCNTHISLHLGDCCLVDKELKKHTIEKIVWDSSPNTKKTESDLVKRAVVGGVIAGSVGAMVGVASGIDKNLKSQDNIADNYHIEYINDDSYIISLTSNIVWGIKFSFLINKHRTNYIKFNDVVYEKMDELYIELKKNMLLAQQYRQQMYAWMSIYNDMSQFKENSDKALECLKIYDPSLYDQLIEEMKEKRNNEIAEKEKKKKQYMLSIEEKEKRISEWQDKYDLYKNKKFGEGKKMKDYCYSQLVRFQEEKESLKEALAKLEEK